MVFFDRWRIVNAVGLHCHQKVLSRKLRNSVGRKRPELWYIRSLVFRDNAPADQFTFRTAIFWTWVAYYFNPCIHRIQSPLSSSFSRISEGKRGATIKEIKAEGYPGDRFGNWKRCWHVLHLARTISTRNFQIMRFNRIWSTKALIYEGQT